MIDTLENKERLCYADTDSIHLTGLSNQEMNSEYPMSFCYWVGGATMSNLTKEQYKRIINSKFGVMQCQPKDSRKVIK